MAYSRTTMLAVVLALTTLAGTGTSARAQNSTSFVASSGNDAGNCSSPATACRSFDGAQSKTDDGGSIACVDPAHYLSVTITKSLTIDCLAGGGATNAISVLINAPGKTVRLRNLAVNVVGLAGGLPLDIAAAASVHLENVLVTGSLGIGIRDRRAGPVRLLVSDSSVIANGGVGILIVPASGVIGVVLDNVRSNNNTYGVAVGAGGRVMIKRSVFSWNGTAGLHADPGAIIGVNDTLVSHNETGIAALNGSNVALSNSDIDSNTTGISGTTRSHGNNRLFANVSDGTLPVAFGGASSEFGQR